MIHFSEWKLFRRREILIKVSDAPRGISTEQNLIFISQRDALHLLSLVRLIETEGVNFVKLGETSGKVVTYKLPPGATLLHTAFSTE